MQNYYEINVALNGFHFFATDPRSCQTEKQYKELLKIIKEKFPESEGYHVTATYWDCSGKILDTKQLETKRENKFTLIIDDKTYEVEFNSDENIVAIDIDRYDYGSTRTAFFVTDKTEIELNSIAISVGCIYDFEKELEEESGATWLLSVCEDGEVIKSEHCDIDYNITIKE